MKKLILVGAPPACGKNYVSELICQTLEHVVYLDKDDLGDLLRCTFELCGEKLNMDGDFYAKNLHKVEYDTLFRIAFSALRFERFVLVNAPFVKEVRDKQYINQLKERARQLGAEIVLIWVTAPISVCFERMRARGLDRDAEKLIKWEEYAKSVEYNPPMVLKEEGIVDEIVVFDNENDATALKSLNTVLKILEE